MSNHHHLVITDPRGVLPDFLRELHRTTAKALNVLHGESENLWAAEPCSAVRLGNDEDIVDKIAYVVANPVAAGLVQQPEDWPGLARWGESLTQVKRPGAYFSRDGDSPERIVLRVCSPEGISDRWKAKLRRAIRAKVSDARDRLRIAGRRFVGRIGVLGRSHAERAHSFEEKSISPTVAAADPATREHMLDTIRAFRIAYSRALEKWREGVRNAVFPFGTWWMRVYHAAKTADA